MILQFDVGNTRIKWRLLEKSQLVDRGSAVLGEFKVDSLGVFGALEGVQLAAVRAGAELERLVGDIKRAYPEVDVFRAKAPDRFGEVRFTYEFPETQGVDRCLAMIAAYELFSRQDGYGGLMVIDVGSAITVDVLGADGVQVEGYILPGLAMMREALLGRTSKISKGYQAGSGAAGYLSTRECVDRGVNRAFVASVQDFINSAKAAGLDLVLTGGDACMLKNVLSGEELCVVEDLVLDGLAIVAAGNVA